jgi:membrane-associated phospholipid phosphatase
MEASILLWIQNVVRNPVLDPIMIFFTKLGNAGAFWIVLSIILLIPKKTRRVGITSALALLIMLICNNYFLKNLFDRTRPYDVIEGLKPLVARLKDSSFPSGHAAAAFASASVIFRGLPKKYSVWAIVLAAIIAVSRLYVGVHYPTDVLAGIVLGILYGLLAEWIVYSFFQGKEGI